MGKGSYLIGNLLLEATGWLFISTGPSSELFAEIRANVAFSMIIAIVCLVASFVLTILIARTLSQ